MFTCMYVYMYVYRCVYVYSFPFVIVRCDSTCPCRHTAKIAINLFRRIFRGHMARQYAFQLKNARNERERKAAVQLQR